MARQPAAVENENLPEADRLEGFAHPRETPKLFGHVAAERVLAEALASGRIHHAWLLCGPEGIGKATLAYRFARAALARADERDLFGDGLEVDPNAPTARQVLAQAHPGLIAIRRPYDPKSKRFAATIPVDEVRRLRSFLSLSAEEGGWRIVIVDSADEMNANAANALLKSLEEPPQKTVFLIVSSEPGRLLPTIRSRCRMLHLEGLSREDMKRAVAEAFEMRGHAPPSDGDLAGLEPLSQGSVRRMLSLAGSGGLALQGRIETLVASLPALDRRMAHQLADELQPAAAEQKFDLFFDLFFAYLARLVKAAASGEGSAADLSVSRKIIGPARVATFAQLWETLAQEKAEALTLNLDRKALILDALAKVETAARS